MLSPCDPSEVYKSVFAAHYHKNPVYIRLTGGSNVKPVYQDDYDFVIGEPNELVKGDKEIIISTGSIVSNCLEVVKQLKKPGLGIINMHTLKPINEKKLFEMINDKEKIFSFEEHSEVGGLASIIRDIKEKYNLNFKLISTSLPDDYFPSGEYEDILKRYKLDINGIKETIIKNKL